MRERIIDRLREAARLSQFDAGRWRELKERLGDIAISTIDAFCLSLLREFPLEADVDPGFDLADDTEAPRLIAESLDRALRICRGIAREDDDVALVFRATRRAPPADRAVSAARPAAGRAAGAAPLSLERRRAI
jgi:ATP-dependent helicase/nuclease subunit A